MYRYCPQCGDGLEQRWLEADRLERLICRGCSFIFYQNPKVVVGTLPRRESRVLLLRRGLEPRRGTWTFPAGFLEMGETVEEAARRETIEECGLDVRLDALLNVYSRPEIGIVNIIYLATVTGGEPQLNPEALAFGLLDPDSVPWEELAFQTTQLALRDWVAWERRQRESSEAHDAS